MSAKNDTQKFIDNIGRRIRHINEDLRKNPDDFRKAGLERQKKNLDDFRKQVKELAHKNDNNQLTEQQLIDLTYEFKTNENYTTDKKKIDEITMKMEMAQEEDIQSMFDWVDESQPEDTGFDDSDVEGLNDLFFSDISGKYIGQSGDPDARNTAFDIIEKANEYLKRDLSERDKAYLNRLTNSLSSALASKGSKGVLYSVS